MCRKHYVFGLSVRERVLPCVRPSLRVCVLLPRYLIQQWTEFHRRTLVDDVDEATDEGIRFWKSRGQSQGHRKIKYLSELLRGSGQKHPRKRFGVEIAYHRALRCLGYIVKFGQHFPSYCQNKKGAIFYDSQCMWCIKMITTTCVRTDIVRGRPSQGLRRRQKSRLKTVVTWRIKHLQKCFRAVDFPRLCRGRKNVIKMFYLKHFCKCFISHVTTV